MTRNEYTDRVLSVLRRVTAAEREAIRAELDAHMEDHICDLLELGYGPELAEERTMAMMGDPEEVGWELDKQYPLGWLLLGRIAVTLTVLACMVGFLGFGVLSHLYWSLEARIAPDEIHSSLDSLVTERPDIRVRIGNDILRVYRVSIGRQEDCLVAEIAMCAYDRLPGGIVSGRLLDNIIMEDQRGNVTDRFGGSGKSNWGAEYSNRCMPVEPGDTYVTLLYDRLGESVSVQVPLPEEVTP